MPVSGSFSRLKNSFVSTLPMKCTGSQVVVDNHLTDEIVPACHNICKCKFSNILPGFQKLLSPDTWFRVEKVVEILPPDNPFLLLLLELCAVYANRPGHIPLEVGQLDEGHKRRIP